ncbi:MAG TPA: hypothetical protein VGM03_16940 [Phycisphaerae bacterium]
MMRRVIISVLLMASGWMGCLWIASYWHPLKWIHLPRNSAVMRELDCGVSSGGIWCLAYYAVSLRPPVPVDTSWAFYGIRCWQQDYHSATLSDGKTVRTFGYTRATCLSVPVWLPVLLLLIYPAVSIVCGRFRRRRRRGTCPKRGYDLTANTSGICPECGTHLHEDPDTLDELDRAQG